MSDTYEKLNNIKDAKECHKKKRHGFNMIELVIGMVVIGILGFMGMTAGIKAKDQSQITVVQNDLRVYESAIRQVMVEYPTIMKFKAGAKVNGKSIEATIVDKLNEGLEKDWQFTTEFSNGAADGSKNGAVAYTADKRDSWGNPYGLYIYMDDMTSSYKDRDGQSLKDSDSQCYIVVASAGKNLSGVVMGDGSNYNNDERKIISRDAMINNTDGSDDMGMIIRILNNDISSITFGGSSSTLGSFKNIIWIFGAGSGGNFAGTYSNGADSAKGSASIDEFRDLSVIEKVMSDAGKKQKVIIGSSVTKVS